MWLDGRACVSSSLSIYYNVVLRNRRSDLTYSVMFVVLAKQVPLPPLLSFPKLTKTAV